MSKDLFDKKYHQKRKKLQDLSIQIDDLTDDIQTDFFIAVSVDCVESLNSTIEKHGVNKHKNMFDEFCKNYHQATMTNDDFVCFDRMYKLYGDKMAEHQKFGGSEE